VTRARDIRETRTDRIQRLVDEAFDNPAKRGVIASRLFGDQPVPGPPGNWPIPSIGGERLAHTQCRAAAEAAYNQLQADGKSELTTGFREHPRARIEWDPLLPEQPLPLLPLARSVIETEVLRTAMTLASYAFVPYTAKKFDEDNWRRLMRRLNELARLEIELWRLAAMGGHTEPPPYTVRFYLARWFWHPSISGALFCLRCGDEVPYVRRARAQPSGSGTEPAAARTGRCRACSRGREDDWPDHALDPYRRGTWLLQCTAPGCTELFVGRRQARHCERHRSNRLARSRRVRANWRPFDPRSPKPHGHGTRQRSGRPGRAQYVPDRRPPA
jgi:hypothetical protein